MAADKLPTYVPLAHLDLLLVNTTSTIFYLARWRRAERHSARFRLAPAGAPSSAFSFFLFFSFFFSFK